MADNKQTAIGILNRFIELHEERGDVSLIREALYFLTKDDQLEAEVSDGEWELQHELEAEGRHHQRLEDEADLLYRLEEAAYEQEYGSFWGDEEQEDDEHE